MNLRVVAALIIVLSAGPASAATTNAPSADDLFQISWESDLSGEVHQVKIADLNGDGAGEVVADSIFVASFGKSGTIYGLDGRGSIMWKYLAGLLDESYTSDKGHTAVAAGPYLVFISPGGQELWKRATRESPTQKISSQVVYAADMTGDKKDDVLDATSMGVKGGTLDLRGNNGDEIMSIQFKGLDTPYSMYSADLNGDGAYEIIVGTLKYSINTIGGSYQPAYIKPATLNVYDSSGALKWSDNYENVVSAVRACDIDNDGQLEVLAGSIGKVVAYAPQGKRIWVAKVDGQVNELDCGNLEGGNGTLDVVVAAGNTVALKPNGEKLWEYASSTANALKVYDFTGDGRPEVVVGSGSIRVVDSSGQGIYKSPTYGTITSLDVGNLSDGGYASIIFGSKDHKVRALDSTKYSLTSSADRFYLMADKAYKDKDYNLTVYYGNRASELYDQAGRAADKTKAANLIAKAGQYSDGDRYYNMSATYFQAGDYKQAIEYADKAIDEYRRVNDMHRMTDLSDIKAKSAMIPNAEANMNLTRQYFSARDWVNAIDYSSKAKTAYVTLKNDTLASEADAIADKSRAYLEFSRQIDEAHKYVKENDKGNATYHISLAEAEYQRLNDTSLRPGIDNVSSLVNSIKRSEDVITYGGIGIVALIILLILVAMGLIITYFLKKGGSSGLGNRDEARGSSFDDSRRGPGGGGLRELRGKRGESIGDSFKR